MKHNKLPSVIALSISLELVLSPLPAFAESGKGITGQQVLNTLQFGMGLYDTVRGNSGQMPPHVSTDMAALQQQQTPATDKHFNLANMQKIPGLMEYIAVQNQKQAASGGKPINPASLNCQTLPTTLHEANNEICRNKEVSALNGNPQLQADEAFAYYNQYMQIDKLYSNYSVNSNVGGQAYGVGCMNDAMKILEGFFAYRLEQLDVVVANMEAATAKFEEQSEMDLKAIRESSAVLNGESSRFAGEFKDSDLFDYGKRFENAACNSIFSKDKVKDLGSDGGLLGIEKKLKTDLASTPAGSKYSVEQYIGKHASVVEDIRKMADKVSTQANLNFSQISSGGYSNFLGSLSSDVSSESGAHMALNKSFFSDLQQKFTESNKKLTDEVRMVSSELGGRGSEALGQLGNIDNDSSFDAELGALENQIKGDCINRSGIESALGRIYDPNLSKSANKHSAAQIAKRIKAIIGDIKRSPEDKLKELSTIDGIDSGRFQMKMDDGYEVTEVGEDGKTVKTKRSADGNTPYAYIKDIVSTCESQFQVNKLGNKLSAKEAIKRLRTLKQDYKKAARQHSKDIKDEIVKKMIDCGGNNDVANSSSVGSCGPEKLNMMSPGFCAKGAFSCAKNIQSCTEKAQKFVKEIKDDRLKRTTNYNNNVEANRKQLVGMFDTAMVKYMKEAESLRAHFGAGFTPPSGITRDIKDGSQFNTDYKADAGDQLEIKDPKRYLKMVKEDLAKLRTQIDEQQKGIIGSSGTLAGHIKQTQDNYKTQVLAKAKKLAADCLAAYNSYGAMMKASKEASDKAYGELGEKKAAFCGRYSDIMSSNPIPGCDDGYSDVTTALITAAGKAGDSYTSAEAYRLREQMAEVCGKPGNQRSKEGKTETTAAMVCTKATSGDKTAIAVLETYKKTGGTWSDVCTAIRKSSGDVAVEQCKLVPGTTTTPATGGSTVTKDTYDCSALEASIVSDFDYKSGGSITVDEDDTETYASNDVSSFCNGSANAGPFNFKGGYGLQNNGQNPLGSMGGFQ